MDTCIFCKIIRKEIPSHFVYEDDDVVAFLDILPTQKGHTLVVPRVHWETFLHTDDVILGKVAVVAKKIGKALEKTVDAEGVNIIVNNGAAAGQVVFHLHTHVIPRFSGDGLKHWPGTPYKEGEADTILKDMKRNI
ncbi:MAG: HIT family protein [bacterium]|nr:HIT family protein [bacterium]